MSLPTYDYVALPERKPTPRKHKAHKMTRVLSSCLKCGEPVIFGCAFRSHVSVCIETETKRHRCVKRFA